MGKLIFINGFVQELHLDELLTHEVPLEDINKAFQIIKEPDCVKVLIKIK